MATTVILRSPATPWPSNSRHKQPKKSSQVVGCRSITFTSSIACCAWRNKQSLSSFPTHKRRTFSPLASLSPSSSSSSPFTSTKLYVSGLSFRTTEESLRNAFQNFGQLVEVNLVMDRIANRPRGFAFLRYETEEESQKAIEGMHGKEPLCIMDTWIDNMKRFLSPCNDHPNQWWCVNFAEGETYDIPTSFLDGRVIFVEYAKPRSELRQTPKQNPRRY